MTLDELLLEWSYRSDRGYPSVDNPSDVLLLKDILRELKLPEGDISELVDDLEGEEEIKVNPDQGGEEEVPTELPKQNTEPEPEPEPETEGLNEYDELIMSHLGVDQIPKSKNTYNFSKNTFDEQVKADDLDIWKKLWTAKPAKKTGDKTETLGVGKGELSLYWLYSHSQSVTAGKLAEGRGDDAPDLWFNGEGTDGVEVKAYSKPNGVIDVGRFGKFRDNLKILNIAFGVAGLAATFDGNVEDQKQKNALSWYGSDLKEAFEKVHVLQQVDLEQVSSIWPIFSDIKKM